MPASLSCTPRMRTRPRVAAAALITITVRVIDRGPYVAGRMWDLSRATCTYLDSCYTAMIEYRFP